MGVFDAVAVGGGDKRGHPQSESFEILGKGISKGDVGKPLERRQVEPRGDSGLRIGAHGDRGVSEYDGTECCRPESTGRTFFEYTV